MNHDAELKDTKEKGCLSYDFFCDLDDRHVFSLIKEWETREDLDRHRRSERFSVLLGTKSLLGKPPDMKILTIALSEEGEILNVLRGRGTSNKAF
jgi:quinol monooxygenase YgiN